MEEVEVVHKRNLKKGESARGLLRLKAFETDTAVLGCSQLAAGAKSGWHHHGSRELYAYIASGKLRVEFGQGGRKSVEVEKGDFVHVPAGVVHQDVNPKKRKEAMTVYILLGEGPTVVNAPKP